MKNRKMWSFLMVIVMIFSAFLSQVGIASATSLTGSGTEESPYLIRTIEDLYQIESNITAHYKLANDIDGENFTKVAMPEF